ncbi:MAG: Mycothiol acetyltransferase [Chloroflexi bacterium ADurb.Bin180]|nr:MAG: Mycothiol acetyltransferase [Chloroflexi bacterium ADurb.Bin180]HOU25213.1 GNAT family N-acetyltransferase [Anaerolineae bacterium]HQJ51444.1 GNAT family N-acetyltransferase [Anaerolineae bacterium]
MSNGARWASRGYRDDQDLRQMLELIQTGRAATGDWQYWHVGELLYMFYQVDRHLVPGEHIRVWHTPRGALIGYAFLGVDPLFDWQVAHGWLRCGIEEEALEWAQARLDALHAAAPERWKDHLTCLARLDDAERVGFLERGGFVPGKYVEVNHIRPLTDPIVDVPVPDGYEVRAVAGRHEFDERSAVDHAVWGQWQPGKLSGQDYLRLTQLPGYDGRLDIVAVGPEGRIAAYVNGWNDVVNRIGDFGPVGTRAEYRQRGLGKAVLTECLRQMEACGMERVCVSTGENNTAARRLYESVGFRVVNRTGEFERTNRSVETEE